MQFDQQARAFCCGYPTYRAQARVFLGTLYRDADYPCDVSSLFSFEVAFEPVPDSAHFFTDLAAAQLAHFRADLERRNQERMMLMQRELYERLIEPVRKMAEALQQPDKIFRDTLVGNVGDIAELMDGLNVFGDPFLAEAAAELRRTLATLNPETLRNSPRERQKAAEDARRMADSIAARMGPFMGAIAPAVAA